VFLNWSMSCLSNSILRDSDIGNRERAIGLERFPVVDVPDESANMPAVPRFASRSREVV
jgi:hypothetical protein